MKAINKNQFLDKLENRVEQHIQEAVKIYQNSSKEILLQPAINGGWSIAQCLDHLNSYGDYYLPYIKATFSKEQIHPVPDVFKSSWLGTYFTRLMEPETGKKRHKAHRNHVPAPNLNAYAVVAVFIEQQETSLAYIKQAQQIDLNRNKIPVSIAKFIKLNVGDVLQFLVAHNERHLQQASRNLVLEKAG